MLLPLLQRIVTGDGTGSESTPSRMSTSGSSTSNSSPFFVPTPNSAVRPKPTTGYSTDISEASNCRFSSEEMLKSKPRNAKSSSAHSFFHVSSVYDALAYTKPCY